MVAKTKRGEKWLRWGWVALYAADPSPLPPALSGFPTVMLFPRAMARLRSGWEPGRWGREAILFLLFVFALLRRYTWEPIADPVPLPVYIVRFADIVEQHADRRRL